jgi:hypothetical protein
MARRTKTVADAAKEPGIRERELQAENSLLEAARV